MIEFIGDWTDEEKKAFEGIGNANKTRGRSFVSNPWQLTKADGIITVQSNRQNFGPMTGNTAQVGQAIQQFYRN